MSRWSLISWGQAKASQIKDRYRVGCVWVKLEEEIHDIDQSDDIIADKHGQVRVTNCLVTMMEVICFGATTEASCLAVITGMDCLTPIVNVGCSVTMTVVVTD